MLLKISKFDDQYVFIFVRIRDKDFVGINFRRVQGISLGDENVGLSEVLIFMLNYSYVFPENVDLIMSLLRIVLMQKFHSPSINDKMVPIFLACQNHKLTRHFYFIRTHLLSFKLVFFYKFSKRKV